MNKKYKKATLLIVIVLMMGLIGYNFVNEKKAKSQDQKTTKQQINSTKENDSSKNKVQTVANNEKNREFKNVPLKYNNKSVPVIMYHSIDYEEGNELRVPKEKFREQMKYLKDNGYTTLTLEELYNFMYNNKPIPEKSVVLTFDDGYKDNYENAYPVLKEFAFKATVFIITNCIDKDKGFLTSAQLKEMDKNGVDIESHTLGHDKLSELPYDKQVETLKGSKDVLEKLLNRKVKYIGYPYGKSNSETVKAAKDTGYNMAFTTESGWSNKNQGIYTLNRVYISANHSIKEFERRISDSNYNISVSSNEKKVKVQ
ncbi:polysaccharide deacetylase family protein [Clostridium sp. P21]|uniref:Polysaccharide deacetylase family protein n=1 Tax=Clostridium muellerianum TaxID=2716538 RepID=A0A7Y0HMH6_9CLOT|nr:polysaccharide deacetylase family protein [Clostridium muellerianum]NMM61622.1 polysaccharide deacetylase family protein [Clostridium muellerianum]